MGFRPSGSREGSTEFVMASGDPRVDMTEIVTWQGPEGDIDGADSFVKSSVEATNRRIPITAHQTGAIGPGAQKEREC